MLFDWLMSVDMDAIPIDHPAQKQALMDLLARLETDTDVPYGRAGTGLTEQEVVEARSNVAKDMGW